MSVDWTVVCDRCREYCHLGQDMGGTCSFGYGSKDEEGRVVVGEFISEHIYHDLISSRQPFPFLPTNRYLRIVRTDDIPDDYSRVHK